ncbi:hypothetical protein CALVIDRAFT_431147 [Calocera viscosa TUFC12733]|uniref:Uncharacterized protein n=1 Tax=Calocera viscosa (strain TUFC12733) TaxID=1330018 RepID=A0A167FZE0_CALVF|nr:hypothetical protein CALVIDRAFT_431147 [Calocera viscosa TUFC12733]
MLTASDKLIFIEIWNLTKKHECNFAFVEALMKARSNLDRSDVNEIIQSIRRKVDEEKLGEPTAPTVMNPIFANNPKHGCTLAAINRRLYSISPAQFGQLL